MLISRFIKKTILMALVCLQFSSLSFGNEFCARIFVSSPGESNQSFLHEPQVKLNPEFGVPNLENYFDFPRFNKNVISQYTGNLAYLLNREIDKKEGLRSVRFLKIMDDLNAALGSLKAYNGRTYSGAALRPETFQELNLEVGKTFSFNYFISTSIKKSIAEEFMNSGIMSNKKDRIPVLFVIDGINGRNIVKDSNFAGEDEVLFRSDAQFKVEKISTLYFDWRSYFGRGKKGFIISLSEVSEPTPQLKLSFFMRKKRIQSEFIEAQRLYDSEDWQKALKERPQDPWNYYGAKTYENWKNADEYLKSLPEETSLSWSIFEKVHEIALKDHPFMGWQKRIIRSNFRRNIISENQALDLLDRVDQGENPINPLIAGSRDKTGDFFTHSGDNETKSRHRYFTKNELELFLRNPFYYVDMNKIQKVGDNGFLAEFHYVYPKNLQKTVDETIQEGVKALEAAKTYADYVWAVVKIEHALLSIHPFSDGNGRTIRLVGDWLLRKRKLPVPLRPITTELSMTVEEYYNENIKAMNEYSALTAP